MSILIENVWLEGKECDLYIEKNLISKIGQGLGLPADKIIDGRNKAVIPSFLNSHTHSAMTLFRGYADDLPLKEWLTKKIWPLEAKLTEDDVYWGAKLACLEMIKSGTTFFNDMYWHWEGIAKASEEMGLRAAVSSVFIDFWDKNKAKKQIEENESLYKKSKAYSERIIFSLGPHAIYSVSEESLRWASDFSARNNLLVHIHLSETEEEVKDCVKSKEMRPVEYLEKIGFLSRNLVAAHSVWLSDREIEILTEHKVKVVFNPVSNMKLAIGKCFRYKEMKEKLLCLLGTDGASSNNNLDLLESMKFASLITKFSYLDPEILSCQEVFNMATKNPASGFNIPCGEIKEGNLADVLLIELNRPELTPGYNLTSDLIYSANSSCIETTICDGKILMENRKVYGEEEIIQKAKEVAYSLVKR
ncbi:amidohydrolase [bacterium]|nr:amidohydrolase [bacterium]